MPKRKKYLFTNHMYWDGEEGDVYSFQIKEQIKGYEKCVEGVMNLYVVA